MQYIFDTNYYRGKFHQLLKISDFESQIEIEKAKGHTVLFPVIVALELLNHFRDGSKVSDICYESLKLLMQHANRDGTYSIIPTMYPILSHHLYNKKSKFDDLNQNVFDLSTSVLNKNLKDILSLHEKYFQDIENFIIQEKRVIISNIENNYISVLSDNASQPDWEILKRDVKLNKEFKDLINDEKIHKIIGLAFVKMAAEQTESNTVPFEKDYFENVFVKQYKVSIDFYIEQILRKLIDLPNLEKFYLPETDKKKRWNSFYDMQLILATEFENCQNRETIFVTSENKIIESFQKHGKEKSILHSDDYESSILQ